MNVDYYHYGRYNIHTPWSIKGHTEGEKYLEVLKCCVTGHRDVPKHRIEHIRVKLRQEIESAIKDGFRYFLSGFADGSDLLFSACVLEEKKFDSAIFLEAVLPYRSRLNSRDQKFQELIKQCDKIYVYNDIYDIRNYHRRNEYMVDNSQRILAVFDGRQSGGTFATIKYAQSLDKQIKYIYT